MLDDLKGLFSPTDPAFAAVAAWARRRSLAFRRARDGEGFIIEGALDGHAWRLEWGPSQRPYIESHELRLRSELGLPPDLQMLVMTRTLKELLEKQAFEQFTQSNQTEVGTATPEETRWLVMFPKFGIDGSKTLRGAFSGVSSLGDEGPAWLDGPLAHALERAAGSWLSEQPPFVLMTQRGRLSLRLQLAEAGATEVSAALDLFETAASEAIRVGRRRSEAARQRVLPPPAALPPAEPAPKKTG